MLKDKTRHQTLVIQHCQIDVAIFALSATDINLINYSKDLHQYSFYIILANEIDKKL